MDEVSGELGQARDIYAIMPPIVVEVPIAANLLWL